jgi:poly(3-hydroxybutyrate) depolymerase
MFKKILTTVVFCVAISGFVNASSEKKTFQIGGFDREYLIYVPENQNYHSPGGVIVALHGFNGSTEGIIEEHNLTSLANSLNYIILAPQALPEQSQTVLNQIGALNLFLTDKLYLNAVWGSGLTFQAYSKILFNLKYLDVELKKDTDDVGFIDSMISRTLNEYPSVSRNVFVLGSSLGGYMAYQYALKRTQHLSGIITVAGSMGINIKGLDEEKQVPLCDFHSTTDNVVHYTGNYEQSGSIIYLGYDKSNIIQFWVEKNSAGSGISENVNYYPSTNGATVEKITYPGENEVIHYKITGVQHFYIFREEDGDCMDYLEEFSKFILAHSYRDLTGREPFLVRDNLFYPNPARDIIHLGFENGEATLYDWSGRVVISKSFHSGQLDVSSLASGIYFIRVQSDGNIATAKLTKR